MAWLITSHIMRRLNRIVSAMTDIASGHGGLNHTLHEHGNDELSELAVGFNLFVTKIRGVVELVINSSAMLAEEADRMLVVTGETKQGVEEQQDETN